MISYNSVVVVVLVVVVFDCRNGAGFIATKVQIWQCTIEVVSWTIFETDVPAGNCNQCKQYYTLST